MRIILRLVTLAPARARARVICPGTAARRIWAPRVGDGGMGVWGVGIVAVVGQLGEEVLDGEVVVWGLGVWGVRVRG